MKLKTKIDDRTLVKTILECIDISFGEVVNSIDICVYFDSDVFVDSQVEISPQQKIIDLLTLGAVNSIDIRVYFDSDIFVDCVEDKNSQEN